MLEQSVYGNTIFEWLIAASFALVASVALVASRTLVLHRLTARNAEAHPHTAARMRAICEGTRPWFLIMVAVFIGAQVVELPRKADRFVDHVTIIAVIAQTAVQQEGIVLVHQGLPAPVAAESPRGHRDAGPPARASLRSG